jgi:hypothetical protein
MFEAHLVLMEEAMKVEESTDQREMSIINTDEVSIIVRYSPFDGKFYKAEMQLKPDDYYRWKNGHALIQDALPYLSNAEREFLLTGYTPEQWKKLFPPDK